MTSRRDVARLEHRLAVPGVDARFTDDDLDGLPGPACRYLTAAISPGAPIARSVRLEMRGRIKLGARWVRLRAREIVAPHEGFVWAGRAGGVIVGSDFCVDGQGALDWRLFGLVPVARAEGADIARSGAGRAAGEAVWLPTSLLPRLGVRWEADGEHHLQATLRVGNDDIAMQLVIDDNGGLRSVTYQRWGDPGNQGEFGWHPFGMEVTATATFGALTIPTAGRVGWHHGTSQWEQGEFFRYQLTRQHPVGADG